MRPTPRTDAIFAGGGAFHTELVNHARTLERENAELLEALQEHLDAEEANMRACNDILSGKGKADMAVNARWLEAKEAARAAIAKAKGEA